MIEFSRSISYVRISIPWKIETGLFMYVHVHNHIDLFAKCQGIEAIKIRCLHCPVSIITSVSSL